jgi:hypothetical protein
LASIGTGTARGRASRRELEGILIVALIVALHGVGHIQHFRRIISNSTLYYRGFSPSERIRLEVRKSSNVRLDM